MTKAPDLRELVFDILMEILEKGELGHVVLSRALYKYQYLEKADRAFITRIAEGTVERKLSLDYVLDSYSKVKVNKMKPAIRTILRLSLYQILYMDRVPDSAACNEAVKLAKKRGFGGLSGFVNGVLRRIAREKEEIAFPNDSLRYSMPQWIVSLWEEKYGRDISRRMMESFLEGRPLMARCNGNRASREEIVALLEEQGVGVSCYGREGKVLALSGVDYVEGLAAFQRGYIQIQDLSSSLAGDAAGIQEGDFVLDVCGAPGGKGLHAADLLRGTGLVEIRDVSERKVALIEENICRSGFSNVRARVHDALCFDGEMEGAADVVLADLPCSGLGIIGRKPDIKYNVKPESLKELSGLQREILSVVSRYVKPGGTLVYTTCTIDPMENEENRQWILENLPFEPVDITGRLGEEFDCESLREGYIQLLPGISPCDGFFISVFCRRSQEGK